MLYNLSPSVLEAIEAERKANTLKLDELRQSQIYLTLPSVAVHPRIHHAYRNVRVSIAKLERQQIALAEILDAKPIDLTLHDLATLGRMSDELGAGLGAAAQLCKINRRPQHFAYWIKARAKFDEIYPRLRSLVK